MYHDWRRLYDLLSTGFLFLSCTLTAMHAHRGRAVPRGSDILVVRSRPHGRQPKNHSCTRWRAAHATPLGMYGFGCSSPSPLATCHRPVPAQKLSTLGLTIVRTVPHPLRTLYNTLRTNDKSPWTDCREFAPVVNTPSFERFWTFFGIFGIFARSSRTGIQSD